MFLFNFNLVSYRNRYLNCILFFGNVIKLDSKGLKGLKSIYKFW